MAEQVRLTGVVRGVQNRTQVYGGGQNNATSSVNILLFRLEPLDGAQPVVVELRGSRINGTVVDGERVDVFGRIVRGGTFRAKRIVSHETGITVDTKLPVWMMAFGAVVAAGVLAAFVFVGVSFFRGGDDVDRAPVPLAPSGEPPQFREMREKALQDCLANPNFTDEQCRRLYGS